MSLYKQPVFKKERSDLCVCVGFVHSLTEAMAVVEKGLVESELLAKEQINSEVAVYVNGREYLIDPIIKDGGFRSPLYAHQAEQHILLDKYGQGGGL